VFRHPELGEKKHAVTVTAGRAGPPQRVDEVARWNNESKETTMNRVHVACS
jgi:hypothetical protein